MNMTEGESKVTVEANRCNRCGHIWVPAKGPLGATKYCPKCGSPYWNKPRRRPATVQAIPKAATPAEASVGEAGAKPAPENRS